MPSFGRAWCQGAAIANSAEVRLVDQDAEARLLAWLEGTVGGGRGVAAAVARAHRCAGASCPENKEIFPFCKSSLRGYEAA